MSPEDTARCQHGIDLYNAGRKEDAYEIFSELYDKGNDEDVTVLFWLAYTTSDIDEAQVMTNTIKRLEPNHPNLPKLQRKMTGWQQREARKPHYLEMTCPYCHYTGPVHVTRKISIGGWIWFSACFLLFLGLLFVSLLMAYTPVPTNLLDQMQQGVNGATCTSFFFLFLSIVGFFIRKQRYTCGHCDIALGDMVS